MNKRSFLFAVCAGLVMLIFGAGTGSVLQNNIRADDKIYIKEGESYSLDLTSNLSRVWFESDSSALYKVTTSGSNQLKMEVFESNSDSISPEPFFLDDGYVKNLNYMVILGAGKTYRFDIKYSDKLVKNDSKITITKYVDNSPKACDIVSKNFPDARFRVFVEDNLDINMDGYLSQQEIGYIQNLRIIISLFDNTDDLNFSSFKGIENFKNLRTLEIAGMTNLKALDLSKNTKLKSFAIDNSETESLVLSGASSLSHLWIRNTPVKSLDISKNTALESLYLYRISDRTVDVSKNTNLLQAETETEVLSGLGNCKHLKILRIEYYPKETLDLSGLTGLEELRLYSENLTSLDLRNNKKLSSVSCPVKSLTSLKVSGLKELRYLYCENAKIKELDLTGLDSLTTLGIQGTNISSIDLGKVPSLRSLDCHSTPIKTLDISNNLPLATAYGNPSKTEDHGSYIYYLYSTKRTSSGYVPYTFIVSKDTNIICNDKPVKGIPIDEAHFPDVYLRDKLVGYDENNDLILSDFEINHLLKLDLYEGTSDLTGIGYLTCLESISASKSKVTSIDISKNPKIRYVDCSGSNVKTLKLSGDNLVRLNCSNCPIEKLDLSKVPNIDQLECYSTKIRTIDITRNPKLISLCKTGDRVKENNFDGYQDKVSNKYFLFDKGTDIIISAPTATPTPKSIAVTLTLDKKTANVTCGKSLTLKATLKGSTSKVTWKSSDTKIATVDSSGKITSKMAGQVTITATAAGKSAKCVVTVLYKDVTNPKDFWYAPTNYLTAKGVVKGYDKQTKFKPANDCTRAQMVTFLYRLQGEPKVKSTTCKFKDVKKTDYFFKPVIWATENGITTGISKTKFGPQGVCTRAQTVTFLWRMAKKPEPSTKKNKFPDVKKSDYFYKATLWASEKKILAGLPDGTFNPQGKCLRRQMVTFLYKYDKYVNKKG